MGRAMCNQKNKNTVSLKYSNQGNEDTEICGTTATNATECSINEKNACHICKKVFKKSSRWAIFPYCKKKIPLACKKGDVLSCPMKV